MVMLLTFPAGSLTIQQPRNNIQDEVCVHVRKRRIARSSICQKLHECPTRHDTRLFCVSCDANGFRIYRSTSKQGLHLWQPCKRTCRAASINVDLRV